MKSALKVTLLIMVLLLALSFVFTIVGSASNHDGLLNTGIIAWLVTSLLFFIWLVITMLARTRRYKKQERFKAS